MIRGYREQEQMTRILGLVAGMLLVTTLVTTVAAKASTVKLIVSGGSLVHPIDITSGTALNVNIWDGDFIGSPAPEPDKSLPRYTVSFFTYTPRPVSLRYVVYLTLDRQTGEGFVYLPGPGDEWYRQNIGTIMRDGQDGKWHHATTQWSRAIAQAVQR